MKDFTNIYRSSANYFTRLLMLDLFKFRGMTSDNTGFPCFDLVSANYPLQKYMEQRLESRVRDVLINHVLDGLFQSRGISAVFALSGYDYQTDLPILSNEEFEQRVSFEFIVQKAGKKIGVRYTDFPSSSEDKYTTGSVDEVIIIDWKTLALTSGKPKYLIKSHNGIPIMKYSVRTFFHELFDNDTYEQFILFVEGEVYSFHNYLGLTTIPKLTAPMVSDFRFDLEDTIIGFIAKLREYRNVAQQLDSETKEKFHYGYHIIDEETRLRNPRLEQYSEKAVFQSGALDRFEQDKLWEILIGKSDFARSLMTSEYLYSNYQCDSKFDYTSIISGYLKCIEQLLYQIIRLYINDGCYITPNDTAPAEICEYRTFGTSTKKWKRIVYSESNLPYCDISLGSLIYFIKDNENTVRFTGGWKKTLVNCLFTYVNECRNDSFHKHNIDRWSRVEFIRKNTLFLCIFIIGSCWVKRDNKISLGAIIDDRLERIYHHLRKTNYEYYLIQFEGTEPRKMRRVSDIMYPEFDDYGVIKKLVLVFVSPDKVDSDNNPESVLIYREHIPQGMWYVDENGKNIRIRY